MLIYFLIRDNAHYTLARLWDVDYKSKVNVFFNAVKSISLDPRSFKLVLTTMMIIDIYSTK